MISVFDNAALVKAALLRMIAQRRNSGEFDMLVLPERIHIKLRDLHVMLSRLHQATKTLPLRFKLWLFFAFRLFRNHISGRSQQCR